MEEGLEPEQALVTDDTGVGPLCNWPTGSRTGLCVPWPAMYILNPWKRACARMRIGGVLNEVMQQNYRMHSPLVTSR